MAITEKDLQKYIEARGQQVKEHASIWAVSMPSIVDMVIFGSLANLFSLRYNILNIIDDGIFIIGVDQMGKLTPLYISLLKEQIKNVKLEKKTFGYNIEIITGNSTLKYRINKIMIGSSFHKKNFKNVIEKLKNT